MDLQQSKHLYGTPEFKDQSPKNPIIEGTAEKYLSTTCPFLNFSGIGPLESGKKFRTSTKDDLN